VLIIACAWQKTPWTWTNKLFDFWWWFLRYTLCHDLQVVKSEDLSPDMPLAYPQIGEVEQGIVRNMWHIVLVWSCNHTDSNEMLMSCHLCFWYVTSLLHEMCPQLLKQYCIITLALRNHELFNYLDHLQVRLSIICSYRVGVYNQGRCSRTWSQPCDLRMESHDLPVDAFATPSGLIQCEATWLTQKSSEEMHMDRRWPCFLQR